MKPPLWTGAEARGEPRIGSTTIDLASRTKRDVAALDEQATHRIIRQGRIKLPLRHLGNGQSIEIDTAHGGIWLPAAGDYDIA